MKPVVRHALRRTLPVLAAACSAASASAPGHARAAPSAPSLEQAVKASFLFKFAPFVSWPPDALPGPAGAFTICLRGEDPFGATLDEVVRGQKVSGRPVSIRRLGDAGSTATCHMLFAGRSATTGYAPFADVEGQPVLTISDQKSGVAGGMIRFVMQRGRVRFQIDASEARANGLTISSKLLGMAIVVDKR